MVILRQKAEKPSNITGSRVGLVAWTGIEPVTRGFPIRCSTNIVQYIKIKCKITEKFIEINLAS
jgi:hypothetical protein